MKKLFSSLAASTSLAAFIIFLITVLQGVTKTLIDKAGYSEAELKLIEKLGDPTWTDYFFSFLILAMMLMLFAFLLTTLIADRKTFAPAASHIVAIICTVMTVLCAQSVWNGDVALMYNTGMVIASLILVVASYAFLLLYSAFAITSEELKRYI